MANPGDEKTLPAGNKVDSETIDHFVQYLPVLYYGVNRLLDACAPSISRKVIVVLWTLASSTTRDDEGVYITNSDISQTFRDWFVVSEGNISSDVSKVKKELFDLRYIRIEGAPDHIHLTPKGEQALHDTLAKASTVVAETLAALSPEEQLMLKDFSARMLLTIRKPPRSEEPGPAKQENIA